MAFYYTVFNLSVKSDWSLPLKLIPAQRQVDFTIQRTQIPEEIKQKRNKDDFGQCFKVSANEIYLSTWAAHFLISEGRHIAFEPIFENFNDYVRLYILGSAFAAILEQRAFLVLHAACVAKKGRAILLMGKSGSGKSTLVAHLATQGYDILSDDLTAINSHDGKLFAYPSMPFIKLDQTSLDLLGLANNSIEKIHPDLEKFRWPLQSQGTPSEIINMIHMQHTETQGFTTTHIEGTQKMDLLRENYFRQFYRDSGLKQGAKIFQLSTQLCRQVNVISWTKPRSIKLEILTLAIETVFNEEILQGG